MTRYKQSITENERPTDYLSRYLPGSFTQWMADNVGHNAMTIDGKGSLHAMGIISATNCSSYPTLEDLQPVKRRKLKKANEVIRGIIYPERSRLFSIMFSPLVHLQVPFVLPTEFNLDLLWHSAHFSNKGQRANWPGYMSGMSSGQQQHGKAGVSFLPILDLKPSDPTCIFLF